MRIIRVTHDANIISFVLIFQYKMIAISLQLLLIVPPLSTLLLKTGTSFQSASCSQEARHSDSAYWGMAFLKGYDFTVWAALHVLATGDVGAKPVVCNETENANWIWSAQWSQAWVNGEGFQGIRVPSPEYKVCVMIGLWLNSANLW